MYRYRNRSTSELVRFEQPMPVFATHDEWELEDEATEDGARASVAPGGAPPSDPGLGIDATRIDTTPGTREGLLALNRNDLNERAVDAGVEKPETLQNKQAVVDAIEAARRDEA